MAFGILFLVLMVVLIQEFEPVTFIIAAITLIVGYVGRRYPRRAGPIAVVVVMSLLLLGNLPAIVDDMTHPESFVNFAIFGALALALAFVAIISGVAVLTSRAEARARTVVYGALWVLLVAFVVSGVAALTLEDDAIAAGDLSVVAEKIEFTPTALSGSGTVGIFINNKDPIRHTFAIESLDLEYELPANTSRRFDIDAAPGTYEFVCTIEGHDDMKGILTIGG